MTASVGNAPLRAAAQRGRSGGRVVRLVRYPEAGALAGAIVIFAFFAVFAGSKGFLSLTGTGNWLSDASEIGIGALGAGLLMAAGEFDLSMGSVLGAASGLFGLCVVQYGVPAWLAAVITLLAGALVGLINGVLVIKTKLPSFIVTLGTYFAVQGIALAAIKELTGVDPFTLNVTGATESVFAGTWHFFSVSIVWWVALGAVAHWVLRHTVFGNWIMATGGDVAVARSAGVRTDLVKLAAFVAASASAALVGIIQSVTVQSGNVASGQSYQFEFIIAAVVGGVLLTGGYGSVIGVFFGACIYGMADLGVFYTGWDTDWFQAILGGLLLAAVVTNTSFRRKAMTLR